MNKIHDNEDDFNIDTIKRVGQFVLNENAHELKDRLYDGTIISIICNTSKKGGMTLNQIIKQFTKLLSVQKPPENIIAERLKILEDEKRIIRIENIDPTYHPSANEIEQINRREESFKEIETNLTLKLNEKLENRQIANEENKNALMNAMYTVLGEIAAHHGTLFAFSGIKADYAKRMEILRRYNDSYEDFIDYDPFKIITASDEDLNIQNELKEIIYEILNEENIEVSQFLVWIAQGYYFAQIMNIDPECQSYTQDAINEITIYLDTNVLFAYNRKNPSENDSDSPSLRTFLRIVKDLGVKIIITDLTVKEFRNAIASKRINSQKISKMTVTQGKKFGGVSDDLFREYFARKESKSNLHFDDFLDVLLTELDHKLIGMVEIQDINIGEYDLIEDIDKLVSKHGPKKSESVIKHDSFHLQLIDIFRKQDEYTIIGPKYWFLTNDHSLSLVEHEWKGKEIIPLSIFPSTLYGILLPIISPKVNNENVIKFYARLFSSQLVRVGNILTINEIMSLHGDWTDSVTEEAITTIIGSTHVRKILRKQKEFEDDPEEITNEIQMNLVKLTQDYNHSLQQFDNDKSKLEIELNIKMQDLENLSNQMEIKEFEYKANLDIKDLDYTKLRNEFQEEKQKNEIFLLRVEFSIFVLILILILFWLNLNFVLSVGVLTLLVAISGVILNTLMSYDEFKILLKKIFTGKNK